MLPEESDLASSKGALSPVPTMQLGECGRNRSPQTPPRRIPSSWGAADVATPNAMDTPQVLSGFPQTLGADAMGLFGGSAMGSHLPTRGLCSFDNKDDTCTPMAADKARPHHTPIPVPSWSFIQSPGFVLAPSPAMTLNMNESPNPLGMRSESPPPSGARPYPSTPPRVMSPGRFWGSGMSRTLFPQPAPPPPPPCPSAQNVEKLLQSWAPSQRQGQGCRADSFASPPPIPARGASSSFSSPPPPPRNAAASAGFASPPPLRPFGAPRPMDLAQAFSQAEGNDNTDPNDGRFRHEFSEISVLGRGQFSIVYSAKHKTDQHTYAVKVQSRSPPGGDSKAPLREVFALARVATKANSQHLVRYFGSWFEDGAMHIQTELCAGSLRQTLDSRIHVAPSDPRFNEAELVVLLRQLASGLSELHRLGFVHLDIKPDNILTCEAGGSAQKAHYKIADLGLATAADCLCRDELTEGDCRYVPRELLQGSNFDLPKADVFSLGLVCYEAATNPKPMPRNGDEWQQLRNGELDTSRLPTLSDPLLALLHATISPDHAKRPMCTEIGQHSSIQVQDEVAALRAALAKAQEEAQKNRQLAEKYQQMAAVVAAQQLQQHQMQLEQLNSLHSFKCAPLGA